MFDRLAKREPTSGQLRTLLLGARRKWTGVALSVAGSMAVLSVAVVYAVHWHWMTHGDLPRALAILYPILSLRSPVGVVAVVALTAFHSYKNSGLIPTFLLGASVQIGDMVVFYTESPPMGEWNPEPSDYTIGFGFRSPFAPYHLPKLLGIVAGGFLLGQWLRSRVDR